MSVSSPSSPDAPSFAEIEAFTAVVSRGSFSGAADLLGIAKSSVSRRVSSLEARLGARLLQRSTRRMALTEVGQRYHDKVAAALDNLRTAGDQVRETQDDPQGELKITAPVDLGALLGRLLSEFSAAYPKVTVSAAFTQRRVDLVAEGVDVAVRAGELADSSLIVRKLLIGSPVIFAAPRFIAKHGVPTTTAELEALPWVVFRGVHGAVTLDLWKSEGAQPVVVRGPLSGDEFGFIKRAVLEGSGLGWAPSFVVEDEMMSGALVRVLPDVELHPTALSLVYPSREFVPAKVRVFCDFAVAWFASRETKARAAQTQTKTAAKTPAKTRPGS